MKTACVINDFYNSEYVFRAIKSVENQVDEIILVGYKDIRNILSNKLKYFNCKLTGTGERYLYGMRQTDADYIFLLDYDDEFLPDKVKHILEREIDFNKEVFKYPELMDYSYFLKYNPDWHISQYSFSKKYVYYIENLIETTGIDCNYSFDKLLYATATIYEDDMFNILSNNYTIKHYHKHSKTNTINKHKFYIETYANFLIMFYVEEFTKYSDDYFEYTRYNTYLNKFLSEPSLFTLRELTNKYNIPFYKKLYYLFLIIQERTK